jgi:hypothetical protein
MKELTMPIRFSTQAANADFLRDDTETTGASEGMPQGVGAGDTPRERSGRRRTPNAEGEAKPGKDINAAGFVKDQDEGKS